MTVARARAFLPAAFLRVALLVILPLAFVTNSVLGNEPALLAPEDIGVLGPELPVSLPAYDDWALGDQRNSAVAAIPLGAPSYGVQSLMVWEDRRGGDADIYGARISSDAGVLDPGGFPICTAPGDQLLPDVAARVSTFERDYIVVWEDRRDGDADVYGTTVGSDGVVGSGGAPAGGFALSTGAGDQTNPAVDALFTTGFLLSQPLVVWEDTRSGVSAIRGCRLSGTSLRDGAADTGGLLISQGLIGTAITPDTASLVSPVAGHVVVYHYQNQQRIHETVVDKDGVVTFVGSSQSSAYLARPTVAATSGVFLVAWQKDYPGFVTAHNIEGELRTWSGISSSWSPTLLSLCTENRDQLVPQAALNGSEFVVVWQDHRSTPFSHVYGARVTNTGVIRDPNGVLYTSGTGEVYGYEPCVASAVSFPMTHWTLGWSNWRDTTTDHEIVAASFRNATRVTLPNAFGLSKAANRQMHFDLAFDGQYWMGVWEERGELRAGRVDPATGPVDGSGRSLGAGTRPSIGWLDGVYLLTYIEGGNCKYRRLDPSGVPVEPTGVALGSGLDAYDGGTALAAIGPQALVVWVGATYRIWGARIDREGTVHSPGAFLVCNVPGQQSFPDVAEGPDGFLVAWTDDRLNNDRNIYGMRIESDGDPLDLAAGGLPICNASGAQEDPAVAWNGLSYLVAWQDRRVNDPLGRADIYGTPVGLNGAVTYANGLALVADPERSEGAPAIGGGLGEWWLAWSDYSLDPASFSWKYDLRGRRLNNNLQLVESMILATNTGVFPEAIAAGRTHLAFAYRRQNPESPWNWSPRGFVRFVGDPVTGVDQPPAARATILLSPARPNPFNPRTTLFYELPRDGHARLSIEDLRGRTVAVLVDGTFGAGSAQVEWDGKDAHGRAVASGAYFCRLEFGGEVVVRKVALIR